MNSNCSSTLSSSELPFRKALQDWISDSFFTVPRILEIVCFFKFYWNVSHQFFVSFISCLSALCSYEYIFVFSNVTCLVLWPLSSSSSKKRKNAMIFSFSTKVATTVVCLAVQLFHYQDSSSDSWWWFTCCCCPYTIKLSRENNWTLK